MQFYLLPDYGQCVDRFGRRPVLLLNLNYCWASLYDYGRGGTKPVFWLFFGRNGGR